MKTNSQHELRQSQLVVEYRQVGEQMKKELINSKTYSSLARKRKLLYCQLWFNDFNLEYDYFIAKISKGHGLTKHEKKRAHSIWQRKLVLEKQIP